MNIYINWRCVFCHSPLAPAKNLRTFSYLEISRPGKTQNQIPKTRNVVRERGGRGNILRRQTTQPGETQVLVDGNMPETQNGSRERELF